MLETRMPISRNSKISQEIKFGDNDTLSAFTAAMVQADYLFLMTDVDCLYDKNPRTNPDAQPIEVIEDISCLEADVSSAGSSLGTGGMSTKIVAARLATSAGVTTVITRSSNPGNIVSIVNYVQALKQAIPDSVSLPTAPMDTPSLSNSVSSLQLEAVSKPPLHTRFLPDPQPIRDRSFWLLHGLAAHGTIFIDEGAHRALASKAGLLPVGILAVEGTFSQQEAVRLVVIPRRRPIAAAARPNDTPPDTTTASTAPKESLTAASNSLSKIVSQEKPIPATAEIGRALVNYSSAEITRIKGLQSTEIQNVLGYADSEYVALRENISLTKRDKISRPVTPGP